MNDKELYHTIYQKRRLEYGQAERDVMISSLQKRVAELERQLMVLEDALENIRVSHSAHCEHYINVSNHSYKLSGIAEEALKELEDLRRGVQE